MRSSRAALSYLLYINFLFILIINDSWCSDVEQVILAKGDAFSFDCRLGESIYYSRHMDKWSEIKDDDNEHFDLNLRFVNEGRISRVTSESVGSKNTGYYACGKPSSRSKPMNRIVQLVLADVDSFYWSYVCHGPTGSCIRFDDPTDDSLSTFEVADQTYVDLFCCAAVSGYDNINVKMGEIGENQERINVKRKQELDGSWVVCANQHTRFKRTYSRTPEQFTCELLINDQIYSSFTSTIEMKDNLDADESNRRTPPPKHGEDDRDYFNDRRPSSAKRVTIGKQIVIILGISFLCIFLFVLIYFCTKKVLANTSKHKSRHNPVVSTNENSNETNGQNGKQKEEPIYMEPAPPYENSPLFFRL